MNIIQNTIGITYIPNDISGLLPEELNTVNIKEHNNKKI